MKLSSITSYYRITTRVKQFVNLVRKGKALRKVMKWFRKVLVGNNNGNGNSNDQASQELLTA